MMDLRRRFQQFEAEGTVFGSINRIDLENIDSIVPSNEILNVFDNKCGSLDKKIHSNFHQFVKLNYLRELFSADLLLSETKTG